MDHSIALSLIVPLQVNNHWVVPFGGKVGYGTGHGIMWNEPRQIPLLTTYLSTIIKPHQIHLLGLKFIFKKSYLVGSSSEQDECVYL